MPPSLYKYCSEATALAILENGTLQISTPNLFNDLLDMNSTLRLEVDDPEEVTERILDQQYQGFYQDGPLQDRNRFGRELALMRTLFPGPADPVKWREFMRPTVLGQVRDHPAMVEKLSRELGERTAKAKVLCLSASGTSAPMWGTYGSNLEGAVLQFTPAQDESMFRAAHPIAYDGPPLLLDRQQFIDWMSGRIALDDIDIFGRFIFTKDPSWSYEQEWRIFYGEGSHPDQDREYEKFDPADLGAVIVGTRMKPEAVEKIVSVVAERYERAKVKRINRSSHGTYVVEDL